MARIVHVLQVEGSEELSPEVRGVETLQDFFGTVSETAVTEQETQSAERKVLLRMRGRSPTPCFGARGNQQPDGRTVRGPYSESHAPEHRPHLSQINRLHQMISVLELDRCTQSLGSTSNAVSLTTSGRCKRCWEIGFLRSSKW